jgi:alanyl-tRNA synthetase
MSKGTLLIYNKCKEEENTVFRVLLDHSRTILILIIENVVPSNEKRGYVLRRIIRRFLRYSILITNKYNFLSSICSFWLSKIGYFKRYKISHKFTLAKIINAETSTFFNTIKHGKNKFEKIIKSYAFSKDKYIYVIDKQNIFYFYETYGLHPTWIFEILKNHRVRVYYKNFNEVEEKKVIVVKTSEDSDNNVKLLTHFNSNYLGFCRHVFVQCLYNQYNEECNILTYQQKGYMILSNSLFYAESGGQLSDIGYVTTVTGLCFVRCVKKAKGIFIHEITVISGKILNYTLGYCYINIKYRNNLSANHTTTHILNAVLKKVLNYSIIQKGSKVSYNKLRFDFSYFKKISNKQIYQIESVINCIFRRNIKIQRIKTTLKKSRSLNTLKLANKNYNKNISLIKLKNLSLELCGGTHSNRTGDIGSFKVISNKHISTGIQRLEAITSFYSVDLLQKRNSILNNMTISRTKDKLTLFRNLSKLIDYKETIQESVKRIHFNTLNRTYDQTNSIKLQNLEFFFSVENNMRKKSEKDLVREKLTCDTSTKYCITISNTVDSINLCTGLKETKFLKIEFIKHLRVLYDIHDKFMFGNTYLKDEKYLIDRIKEYVIKYKCSIYK